MKICKAFIAMLLPLFILTEGCEPPDIPEPKITSISPDEAGPKEIITIKGNHLTFAYAIHFGKHRTDFSPTGADTVTIQVPQVDPGPTKIYLEYAEGYSEEYAYTILEPRPFINEFNKDTIEVKDTLAIKGVNFGEDPKIFLGAKELTNVLSVSDTLIKLVIQIEDQSGTISVKSEDKTSPSKRITITNSKAPSITSINPETFAAGDNIVIEGQNFIDDDFDIKFNDVSAHEFALESEEKVTVKVPEIESSGFIFISTVYGETSKSFELIDPKTFIPITSQNQYFAYSSNELTITGNNFEKEVLTLKYNGLTLEPDQYSVESDDKLIVQISENFQSGDLVISNKYGSITLSITIKEVPQIVDFLPVQNPNKWPVILNGSAFDEIKNIVFEVAGQPFTFHVNDEGIQYFPEKQVIGMIIPEQLVPGNYKIFVTNIDDITSNKIDYKILTTEPSGLPQTGSSLLVIPNNPPAVALSGFNNVWSLQNTSETISFNDDFENEDEEYGYILDSFDHTIQVSGKYKKDGTYIELDFDAGQGPLKYVGSIDDHYWDDPNSENGVFRVILTPVIEGRQIEMIFPVGLDSLSQNRFTTEELIKLYGKSFHENEFYEIVISDENGEVDRISIDSDDITYGYLQISTDLFSLSPGQYMLQVEFNSALSNKLNVEFY